MSICDQHYFGMLKKFIMLLQSDSERLKSDGKEQQLILSPDKNYLTKP